MTATEHLADPAAAHEDVRRGPTAPQRRTAPTTSPGPGPGRQPDAPRQPEPGSAAAPADTAGTAETLSIAGALNAALRDSLEEDADVVVFGEDVGPLGGVFRVTDGLAAEFGRERVWNSPLAEAGILGTAIGMAMAGMRPVVEMQFDAFSYPALEQAFSHAAKMRNRTRGRVELPLVVRIPYGGGIGGVEHHSDSSEAYWAHTPGLTVVTPSTAHDAYHLLRGAIASQDPVVVFEPKRRYWQKGEVRRGDAGVGFDQARVVREGRDATLLAYGAAVEVALEAARLGAEEELDLEVVDLRTLSPFDDETVSRSVRKTSRAAIIHEAARFGGYGAEVAAGVGERDFFWLDAPVLRVTGFDVPYPAPKLEEYFLPTAERVLAALDTWEW
ncbi:alpha-ketoacid dehydrogenase subunit beta [Gulosibacter sp. 10]|uniref:alpha-ketoacid dehydrogenase subunit beta n=1 Tax=Gulosibacter sp. 10 TaxID=1255570 RepID=UPI00097EA009|nr:alpha-ketoacid dehydrogenase subunit beta [Gulosibacter sp. 10]SJM55685.1 Branched-chain alpha-keto acid dehydrogenase, E1 component, beta subunit [Gulosibacter sp. 10]